MKNGYCYLTELLPTNILGVSIDPRACTVISIILKLDEPDVDMDEKVMYIMGKLFKRKYETVLSLSKCEKNPEILDREVIRFICGAEEVKSWSELHADSAKTAIDGSSAQKGKRTKDFDYVQDSKAIVASFRQVYGLSLDEVCNLHWWEFIALLENLPSEGNAFSMIRELRNKKPSSTDSPEYKANLAKAKRQVALKDTRSPEQKKRDREGMFDNIDL